MHLFVSNLLSLLDQVVLATACAKRSLAKPTQMPLNFDLKPNLHLFFKHEHGLQLKFENLSIQKLPSKRYLSYTWSHCFVGSLSKNHISIVTAVDYDVSNCFGCLFCSV